MQRMIFVVGNSRSGTTMMGRVLGQHPDVFTFNELHFFEQLWAPALPPAPLSVDDARGLIARLLTIQRDGYYTQRDPSLYHAEAKMIAESLHDPPTPPTVFEAVLRYECRRNGKQVGCDQTPRNLYYLKELLELYPDARVVVMVRDPRDVLLSQKSRWKRRRLGAKGTPWWNALRTWAGYHPINISLLWRSGVASGDRFKDNPRVCVLRFEDLLAEPDVQLKRACEAVELEYDPAMLEVPQVGSSHQQDAPTRLGLDPAAANRFKQGGLTDTEIAICQRLTQAHMTRHGYTPEPVHAPLLKQAWARVTWLFKSALALVMNLHRVKRLRESLGRRLRR